MAYTQAQMLSEFRDNMGDINSNERTDYQLIGALRRAYATAWPDWYQEIRDNATYTGYASLPAGTLQVDVPSAFVGGKIYNLFGRTNQYQQGTAFLSPVIPLSGSGWITATGATTLASNSQVQLDGTAIPTGLSNQTGYYAIFPTNRALSATFTNGSNVFTTATNHGWAVGTPITFTGTVPTGFSANTVYYIIIVPAGNTLELGLTPTTPTPIVAGSSGTTTLAVAGFQPSLTSGGTPVTFTASGSGYYGSYVDPTTDYQPFNMWTRGVRIDPLTESSPKIRFTSRDMTTFELRIEGAAPLSYPYVGITAAGTSTLTVTGAYTPTLNDTVFFFATAPVNFNSGGLGAGGLTPYYVVSPTSTTFQLSATLGGAAISTTSTGPFNIYPGSQTLTGTDYTWFSTFLLWQGEVFARAGLQRSGNLDRRAQAQRRLLAQQEADKCRSHRMQPNMDSQFRWDA